MRNVYPTSSILLNDCLKLLEIRNSIISWSSIAVYNLSLLNKPKMATIATCKEKQLKL